MKTAPLEYFGGAALLSACWYPVLLIPPDLREALSALELSAPESILLLGVGGVTISAVFRKAIIEARGLKCVALGALLPFVAMLVFVVAMLLYKGVQGGLGGGDIPSAFIYGTLFTLTGAYVVAPMGIVSELAMRWLGRRSSNA